jgi:hypothetical protein
MFIDPPRSLYVLLIACAVIAAAVCAKNQTRKTLIIFLAFAGLLLALFLIDRFIESPREEATRRIEAMAKAATDQRIEEFLNHVAVTFEKNGRTKPDLRTSQAWQLIRDHSARVTVWNLSREDFERKSDTEIEIGLMCKGEAAQGFLMKYCRATFVLESNGDWKLKTIKFYNPAEHGTRVEDPIPGFP